MGGNGPLYELATLKEFLGELKPRVVIWQFYEGNEARVAAEAKQPILLKYLKEPGFRQNLRDRQQEVDRVLQRVFDKGLAGAERASSDKGPVRQADKKKSTEFSLSDFVRLTKLRQRFFGETSAQTPQVGMFAEVLAEGRRAVEGWGGKLYFLYLPSSMALTSWSPRSQYASRELINSIARDQGLDTIDLYPAFEAEGDPLSFFPYRQQAVHYSARGYELVAKRVVMRLERDLPQLFEARPEQRSQALR
jgi:hypothetical protein